MSDKKQQWALIQHTDPDLALFLTSLTQVFGKPKATSITLDSGTVIKSGEADPPKVLFKTRARFIDGH